MGLAIVNSFRVRERKLYVYTWDIQIIKAHNVLSQDLPEYLLRKVAKFPRDDFPRVGPGGSRVGIVIGPHAGIATPPI